MGLRPFGLAASTGGGVTTGTPTANGVRIPVEDSDVLNNANANNNNSSNNNEDNSAAELRELEESKRFFSRFAPPVAHGANQLHNMVQYSHLGKTKLIFVFNNIKKSCQNAAVVLFTRVIWFEIILNMTKL